jgi:hypothetical protein
MQLFSSILKEMFKGRFYLWLIFSFAFVFYPDSSLLAVGKLRCFGAGVTELFVPGLGYATTKQWDKAVIMGGSRWVLARHAIDASNSDSYQKDKDDIYKTVKEKDSKSGKNETVIYLNRETWEAQYYNSMYSNMLLTTWGDLYMHGCTPNTETYSYMLAPFQFPHFYKKWYFWLPTVLTLYVGRSLSDREKIDFYLGGGLTEKQMRNDAFSQYYMVGVGEEMFFRGLAQNYFFEAWKGYAGFSPSVARHFSVFSGAALFGLAHNGSGFSASPFYAFLFGLYQGYTYHPSIDEFDLTTAIAIHSWYDIIVTYSIYNNATFHEEEKNFEIPLMRVAFSF